jgi:hypothetical protein
MSTCVFYIDEAGNSESYSIPLETGQTPIFCLFALALPLAGWRDFDRDYLQLKRHYFKKEIENSKWRAELWEVKGNELCAPRNKDSRRQHVFLREVFDLCERYDAAAFCVTFLKHQESPMSPEACYRLGLQYLAERLNTYIVESYIYNHGILIADSRLRSLDLGLIESYQSYIFGHKGGRQLTRLVESPLFADSRHTAGLQIADNIAAALFGNHCCYYCKEIPGVPDYSHVQEKYWSKLDSLQFKSKQRYDGYPMYGFKVCDHREIAHS